MLGLNILGKNLTLGLSILLNFINLHFGPLLHNRLKWWWFWASLVYRWWRLLIGTLKAEKKFWTLPQICALRQMCLRGLQIVTRNISKQISGNKMHLNFVIKAVHTHVHLMSHVFIFKQSCKNWKKCNFSHCYEGDVVCIIKRKKEVSLPVDPNTEGSGSSSWHDGSVGFLYQVWILFMIDKPCWSHFYWIFAETDDAGLSSLSWWKLGLILSAAVE